MHIYILHLTSDNNTDMSECFEDKLLKTSVKVHIHTENRERKETLERDKGVDNRKHVRKWSRPDIPQCCHTAPGIHV